MHETAAGGQCEQLHAVLCLSELLETGVHGPGANERYDVFPDQYASGVGVVEGEMV